MSLACRTLRENKNDLLVAAEAFGKLRPDLTTAEVCELLASEFTSCELHDPERT